jgi:Ribbon-helix-helix protein, copG family
MPSRPTSPWFKRCYKFPPAMIEKIEKVVAELGITESELVRRAIDDHLRSNYPSSTSVEGVGVKSDGKSVRPR